MSYLVPTYQIGELGTIDVKDIYARGSLSIHGENSQLKVSSILEENTLYLMANGTSTIQGTLYTLFEQTNSIKNMMVKKIEEQTKEQKKGLQLYIKTNEISNILRDYKNPHPQPHEDR